MAHKTIGGQILKTFLSIGILSILLSTGLSVIYFLRIRDFAWDGNHALMDQAIEDTESSLIKQAERNTYDLICEKASAINLSLQSAVNNLRFAATYATYIMDSKDGDFRPYPVPAVPEITTSAPSLYMMTPTGKTDQLPEWVFRFYHLEPVFASILGCDRNVNAAYFGAEYGFTVNFDAYAQGKNNGIYDARVRPWYIDTKKRRTMTVSEPYNDFFEAGILITIAIPCYNSENELIGIAAMDYKVSELYNNVIKTKVSDGSYSLLLSGNKIIAAPELNKENENNPAYFIGENAAKALSERSGKSSGIIKDTVRGNEVYIFWAELPVPDWQLVMVLPKEGIVADSRQAATRLKAIGEKISEYTDSNIKQVFIYLLIATLIILVMIYVFTIRLSRRISSPIMHLNEDVKLLGDNHWDYHSNIHTDGTEIEQLSNSFENLTIKLKEYILHLTDVTAAKEKIESEIKIAEEIQRGILPKILPPFPKCDYFEVDAYLTPAKEVGGDLYDFFMLSPTRICLVIGDVSGKGIPASLFMAVAQTLHRGMMHNSNLSPVQLVRDMNKSLCDNNSAGLFVTYTFAIINLENGEMTYCNAGHDPFYQLKADGTFHEPSKRHGIPLGVRKNRPYGEDTLILELGDTLFFYTDGIPEAKNEQGEFYGMDRLKAVLQSCAEKHYTAHKVKQVVLDDLVAFTDSAEQFDDITLISFTLDALATK